MSTTNPPQSLAELALGDHAGAIFDGDAEQRALATAYVTLGIARSQKVLYIIGRRGSGSLLVDLAGAGLDVSALCARRQLVVAGPDDRYLCRAEGDPHALIALMQSEMAGALTHGLAGLRVSIETGCALESLVDSGRQLEYESVLNQFLPTSQCLLLCQYDRRLLSSDELLSALSTHPRVIIGGELCDNFYYVPPADFEHADLAGSMARRRLDTLLHRSRDQAALLGRAAMLEFDPNPAVRIAADGRVLYANRAAAELFGLSSGDGARAPAAWGAPVGQALATGDVRMLTAEAGARRLRLQIVPAAGAEYVDVYACAVEPAEG